MGLWSKLLKREVRENSLEGLQELLLQAGISGNVSKENALNIPALASGVDIISDVVASLPVKLFKEIDGKVEEITADNRVFLINDETGDTLDGFQFKKALVADFLLEGNGYAFINRNRNKVESLHYVEANQLSVLMNTDPIFKNYDILVGGRLYRDYEFLKIARKSKNGVTGKGIISEHNKVLSIAFNTLVFEDVLVKTGGNKKGFLKSQGKLSKEAIQSLKEAWANLYSNSSENVVVLNNGLEFEEASSTSVEMQLNERKITNSTEINRILRMPSGKIDEESIKNCISPILKVIETALNKDLLLPSEKKQSFYFAFDTKELLKDDIEKRFRAYEIGVKNGFLQIDEIRYEENKPPLGLDFIKLGLQDVLYNPKTKEIYTPNTNKTNNIENSATSSVVDENSLEGGEEL